MRKMRIILVVLNISEINLSQFWCLHSKMKTKEMVCILRKFEENNVRIGSFSET